MIPTEHITSNGEEYPFHFGAGAAALFGIKTEKGNYKVMDMQSLISESKLDELHILIWCGLKSGAAKAGQEFGLTPDDVKTLFENDPFVLDQAMSLVNKLEEEYSEDIEGNPPKAKGKK